MKHQQTRRVALILSAALTLLLLPAFARASWGILLEKPGWGPARVLAVSPNSAFRDAGVRTGDKIYRINNTSIADLSLKQVIQLLQESEPKRYVNVTLSKNGYAIPVYQLKGQDKHPPYFAMGDLLPMPADRTATVRPVTAKEQQIINQSKHKGFATFGDGVPMPKQAREIEFPAVKGTKVLAMEHDGVVIDFLFGPDDCAVINSPGALAILDKLADYNTAEGARAKSDIVCLRTGWTRVESADDLPLYRELSPQEIETVNKGITKTSVKKIDPKKWLVVRTILAGSQLYEIQVEVATDGTTELTGEKLLFNHVPAYDHWRSGAYLCRGFKPLPTTTDPKAKTNPYEQARSNMRLRGLASDTVVLTSRHLLTPTPKVYNLVPESPIRIPQKKELEQRAAKSKPMTQQALLAKVNSVKVSTFLNYHGGMMSAELRDEISEGLNKANIATDAFSPVELSVSVLTSKYPLPEPTDTRHVDHPDVDYFKVSISARVSVPVVSLRFGQWTYTQGSIASANLVRISAGGSNERLDKIVKETLQGVVVKLFADAQEASITASAQPPWEPVDQARKIRGGSTTAKSYINRVNTFLGPTTAIEPTNRFNGLNAHNLRGEPTWGPVDQKRFIKDGLQTTGGRISPLAQHVIVATVTGDAKAVGEQYQAAAIEGRLTVVDPDAVVEVDGELFRVPAEVWIGKQSKTTLKQDGKWQSLDADIEHVLDQLIKRLAKDRE